MKLTKASFQSLTIGINGLAAGIKWRAEQQDWNVEETIKCGAVETILNQITELESTLRVLKRRLSESNNG